MVNAVIVENQELSLNLNGDVMKDIKLVAEFRIVPIEYRIVHFVQETDEPFTLYYMYDGHWKYCGDYKTSEDAKRYAVKRTDMILRGETVML
jgi:hypothetical protein